jgi:hypothetical protein
MHTLGQKYMPEPKETETMVMEEPSVDISMDQPETIVETAREKPPKPIKI